MNMMHIYGRMSVRGLQPDPLVIEALAHLDQVNPLNALEHELQG